MSNEFSELGGECTYLISSSHLSLNFVVLLFECGECCFDLLVAQESEIVLEYSNSSIVFIKYQLKKLVSKWYKKVNYTTTVDTEFFSL